jgi:hypothetical protein
MRSTYALALAVRACGLVNAVLIIVLGSHLLTASTQGLYYALVSIGAVQAAFELGLSSLLIQFVGRERQTVGPAISDLEASASDASRASRQRLASLLQWSDRWFARAALLCVLAILGLSAWLFHGSSQVGWHAPAAATAAATAMALGLTGRWAIFEGYGHVKEVLAARLIAALASLGLSAVLFALDLGLFVPAVAGFSSAVVWQLAIAHRHRRFWKALQAHGRTEDPPSCSIIASMHRLQWRTALSFLCGYLSAQSITLIAFKAGSPELSATIGIALTLMMASISVASIPLQAHLQGLLRHLAAHDLTSYFQLGRRLVWIGLAMLALLTMAGGVALALLHALGITSLLERVPGPLTFALFMAAAAIHHVIAVQSTLVRLFKSEPYILYSAAVALAVVVGTWSSAASQQSTTFAASYFLVYLFLALPCATRIFRAQRTLQLRAGRSLSEALP